MQVSGRRKNCPLACQAGEGRMHCAAGMDLTGSEPGAAIFPEGKLTTHSGRYTAVTLRHVMITVRARSQKRRQAVHAGQLPVGYETKGSVRDA
jgi:hypothetical protein